MNKHSRKYLRNSGTTLVEVVVTVFIAGIAISGLVTAYIQNLSQWRESSEQMVLHNEGTLALERIWKFVHDAYDISVTNYGGYHNARLITRVYQSPGSYIEERSADFFFAAYDKSLRWNNRIGRQPILNMRLCPLVDRIVRPTEHNYIEVERIEFTPIDPTRPNDHPQGNAYMIKAELVLSSPRGDTLTVTRYMAKSNQKL